MISGAERRAVKHTRGRGYVESKQRVLNEFSLFLFEELHPFGIDGLRAFHDALLSLVCFGARRGCCISDQRPDATADLRHVGSLEVDFVALRCGLPAAWRWLP